MSTGAILPISSTFSSPDYDSSSATASQLSVFNSLVNQLQQAAGSGNIDQTATLLNAVEAISPSSATAQSALGNFLTSLGTAVNDGSGSEAQAALATYQSATPATTAAGTAASSTASTSATAAQIAAGLVQSQLQLSEVTTLLSATAGPASSTTSSSDTSQSGLYNLLSAAYPQSGSSSSTSATSSPSSDTGASSSTAASPYDTLVATLQANLAGSGSTSSTALAYLQSSGNFVNSIA